MKHRAWVVLSVLLLVGIGAILAEEGPPASETPTLTLTDTSSSSPLPPPTETPTPLPSPTSVPTDPPPPTEIPPTDESVPSSTPVAPTGTTETEPSPAPTSTELPTATPLATLPPLPVVAWTSVFLDSFQAPDGMTWHFTGEGWAYTSQADGSSVLQVFNSSAPAIYQSAPRADVAVEITVDVRAGSAHLYARYHEAFSYDAQLTPAGDVVLRRGGEVLAAAQIPDFDADQPHQLRLSVVGSELWIAVDGLVWLYVDDLAPLPPGAVGLGASFVPLADGAEPLPPEHVVTFMDFALYQPADAAVMLPTLTVPALIVTSTPAPVVTPLPTRTPHMISDLRGSEALELTTFSSMVDVTVNNVADLVNEVATAPYGSTKIIRLEPGMYILDRHIAINNRDIFIVGNGSGNPIANADIAPDPATMAIISRNINGASHELFRVYSNGKLTLFNVVLQYGGGANMGWGGGIVNQGSEVHAVLTRFDQNTTWGGGGAIVNVEDGRVTVENSVFTENIGGDGGAVGTLGNYDGTWADGMLDIACSSFYQNTGVGYGGAIYNDRAIAYQMFTNIST